MTAVAFPTFQDAEIPADSVPETSDVEFPCRHCGKEAGPYSGRGRKPTICKTCKPASKGVKRVTGTSANLAGQATEVLVQLNGIMAIGLMAVGFHGSASALAGANDAFAEKANAALLTDPDLCRLILKGGVKSAKLSLGIAYFGLGVSVAPSFLEEYREKKEEREARRAEAEAEYGSGG